jgi:hypothetical protein
MIYNVSGTGETIQALEANDKVPIQSIVRSTPLGDVNSGHLVSPSSLYDFTAISDAFEEVASLILGGCVDTYRRRGSCAMALIGRRE